MNDHEYATITRQYEALFKRIDLRSLLLDWLKTLDLCETIHSLEFRVEMNPRRLLTAKSSCP